MSLKVRLLILVAVVATAAQAVSATAQAGTTVTALPHGTGKTAHHVIDAAGAAVTCAKPNFTAITVDGGEAATLELSGSYTGLCTFVGQESTNNLGGCHYVLHANGEVDVAGANCAAEPITFSVPSPPCVLEIGPQSGLKSASFTNLNEGEGPKREITAALSLTGIKYTATGSGCPEVGTKTTGLYTTGNTLLTAERTGSETMAGLWVESGAFQVE